MPFGTKKNASVDKLTIRKPNSSGYTNIISADSGSGYTLTLPSSIEDGKMLKTDAGGVLSWDDKTDKLRITGTHGIANYDTSNSFSVNSTDDRVLVWDKDDNYIKFAQLSAVCFLKGTKITLSDRTYKNIEDLTLEDEVLTFKINELDDLRKKEEIIKWNKDKINGKFSQSGIRNIWINPTDSYLVINDILNVTPGHIMFYKRDNRYYLSHANKLQINDELMNSKGEYEKIDKIKCIQEDINVYNFEVDNDSTYFAGDYLVHHMCELCSGYAKII